MGPPTGRRISCPRACSLIKATPVGEDTLCKFSARRREKVTIFDLSGGRRFRKTRDRSASSVFGGEIQENRTPPGRGKSQARLTLHRTVPLVASLGGALESVTQSRCAVYFVRAQYTRPESPTTLAPYQSSSKIYEDRGPGCGLRKKWRSKAGEFGPPSLRDLHRVSTWPAVRNLPTPAESRNPCVKRFDPSLGCHGFSKTGAFAFLCSPDRNIHHGPAPKSSASNHLVGEE